MTTPSSDPARHSLPHQETGEAHYEGDGCAAPGETAVPAQAPLDLEAIERREASRREMTRTMLHASAPHSDVDALLAEVRLLRGQRVSLWASNTMITGERDALRAELRATEDDLGVAVQVAAERADKIAAALKLHQPRQDDPLSLVSWTYCSCGAEEAFRAEDGYMSFGPARYPCVTAKALGVGAATGTKGDPPASMLKSVYVPDDDDPSQLKRVKKRPITQAEEDAEAAEWAGTKGDNDEQ